MNRLFPSFRALIPHTGVIKRNPKTGKICGAEVKGGLFIDSDYQKYLRYKASFQDEYFYYGSDVNPHVLVDFYLLDDKETSLGKVKISKRYQDNAEYYSDKLTICKSPRITPQQFQEHLRDRYSSYLATLARDAQVDIMASKVKQECNPFLNQLGSQLLGDALHFVQQVNFINQLYPDKASFPKNARDLSINTF